MSTQIRTPAGLAAFWDMEIRRAAEQQAQVDARLTELDRLVVTCPGCGLPVLDVQPTISRKGENTPRVNGRRCAVHACPVLRDRHPVKYANGHTGRPPGRPDPGADRAA